MRNGLCRHRVLLTQHGAALLYLLYSTAASQAPASTPPVAHTPETRYTKVYESQMLPRQRG